MLADRSTSQMTQLFRRWAARNNVAVPRHPKFWLMVDEEELYFKVVDRDEDTVSLFIVEDIRNPDSPDNFPVHFDRVGTRR